MSGDEVVVRIGHEPDCTLVALVGEIDLSNVDALAKGLDDAVARGLPVVIEVSDLEFIDSAGFAAIHRSVASSDAPANHLVVPPEAPTARSFAVSGLPAALSCHQTFDEARAEIQRGPT
jgi:anti-anti-sigma factor